MSSVKPVGVGIIGCGNISQIYFENIERFDILKIVGCTSLIKERVQKKAEDFDVIPYDTVDQLLANPEIELVVNLTNPPAHAEIALKALHAGKHVYGEKPLAVSRQDGQKILETAREKNLLVGNAPDTFLGAGIQTCRKLVDDGWIGEPVAATAFLMGHGHESWHPNPEFYYEVGGGPMFDMGPYYLTALINLIGPVKRVTGSTRITFPKRTITSQPKYGKQIEVEVPTHIAGLLDFHNGAVGTIITTFDTWDSKLPRIEIYGSEGTLSVPDPNTFGGPIYVKRFDAESWSEIPFTHSMAHNSRGLGVADLAYALRFGRKHRASGELAYHVLDVMHAFHDASDQNKHIFVESTCERPSPLPPGLLPYQLDR